MAYVGDIFQSLKERVRAARLRPTKYADPDMFIGPITGRYTLRKSVIELCDRIFSVFGFNDLFCLLVVEVDYLKLVLGGSHRLQAVIGVVPVRRIPYKVIDISGIPHLTETTASIYNFAPSIVGMVQGTESHSRPYSIMDDITIGVDLWDAFEVYHQRQHRIMKTRNIRNLPYTKDAKTMLNWYTENHANSIDMIEMAKSSAERRRIIRGISVLHEVNTESIRFLQKAVFERNMCMTSAQVKFIGTCSPLEVECTIEYILKEIKKRDVDGFVGPKWKPFNSSTIQSINEVIARKKQNQESVNNAYDVMKLLNGQGVVAHKEKNTHKEKKPLASNSFFNGRRSEGNVAPGIQDGPLPGDCIEVETTGRAKATETKNTDTVVAEGCQNRKESGGETPCVGAGCPPVESSVHGGCRVMTDISRDCKLGENETEYLNNDKKKPDLSRSKRETGINHTEKCCEKDRKIEKEEKESRSDGKLDKKDEHTGSESSGFVTMSPGNLSQAQLSKNPDGNSRDEINAGRGGSHVEEGSVIVEGKELRSSSQREPNESLARVSPCQLRNSPGPDVREKGIGTENEQGKDPGAPTSSSKDGCLETGDITPGDITEREKKKRKREEMGAKLSVLQDKLRLQKETELAERQFRNNEVEDAIDEEEDEERGTVREKKKRRSMELKKKPLTTGGSEENSQVLGVAKGGGQGKENNAVEISGKQSGIGKTNSKNHNCLKTKTQSNSGTEKNDRDVKNLQKPLSGDIPEDTREKNSNVQSSMGEDDPPKTTEEEEEEVRAKSAVGAASECDLESCNGEDCGFEEDELTTKALVDNDYCKKQGENESQGCAVELVGVAAQSAAHNSPVLSNHTPVFAQDGYDLGNVCDGREGSNESGSRGGDSISTNQCQHNNEGKHDNVGSPSEKQARLELDMGVNREKSVTGADGKAAISGSNSEGEPKKKDSEEIGCQPEEEKHLKREAIRCAVEHVPCFSELSKIGSPTWEEFISKSVNVLEKLIESLDVQMKESRLNPIDFQRNLERYCDVCSIREVMVRIREKYNRQNNWSTFEGTAIYRTYNRYKTGKYRSKEQFVNFRSSRDDCRKVVFNKVSIEALKRSGEAELTDLSFDFLRNVLFHPETVHMKGDVWTIPPIMLSEAFFENSERKLINRVQNLPRWQKVELRTCPLIIIPVNTTHHWCLSAVCDITNTGNGTLNGSNVTVYVFNSITNTPEFKEDMTKKLRNLVNEIRSNIGIETNCKSKVIFVKCDHQEESASCGYHTVWYSILLSHLGSKIVRNPGALLLNLEHLKEVAPFKKFLHLSNERLKFVLEYYEKGMNVTCPGLFSRCTQLFPGGSQIPRKADNHYDSYVDWESFVSPIENYLTLSTGQKTILKELLSSRNNDVAFQLLEGNNQAQSQMNVLAECIKEAERS